MHQQQQQPPQPPTSSTIPIGHGEHEEEDCEAERTLQWVQQHQIEEGEYVYPPTFKSDPPESVVPSLSEVTSRLSPEARRRRKILFHVTPAKEDGQRVHVMKANEFTTFVFTRYTWEQLVKYIGHCFGKQGSPCIFIGSTARFTGDETLLKIHNRRFIYKYHRGVHVFSIVLRDDITGEKAETNLHGYEDEVEPLW